MIDPREEKRLSTLFDSAAQAATARNSQAAAASDAIAKEKTQYFEKIALGSGAAIAATVSFLGSHATHLHPGWLLRSALIDLALTMTAALLRNWLYPFYVLSSYAAREFEAKQTRDQCKRDYVVAVRPLGLEDGQPIDISQYVQDHAASHHEYGELIARHRAREKKTWAWLFAIENATLTLAITGMLLLISLAWLNF